jgi:hypothetical protein
MYVVVSIQREGKWQVGDFINKLENLPPRNGVQLVRGILVVQRD